MMIHLYRFFATGGHVFQRLRVLVVMLALPAAVAVAQPCTSCDHPGSLGDAMRRAAGTGGGETSGGETRRGEVRQGDVQPVGYPHGEFRQAETPRKDPPDEDIFHGRPSPAVPLSGIAPTASERARIAANSATLSTSTSTSTATDPADTSRRRTELWLSVVAGSGMVDGPLMADVNDVNARLGAAMSPAVIVWLSAGYGWSRPQANGELSQSLRGEVGRFDVGAHISYAFFPDARFLGPYAVAGLNLQFMGWEYRNAITVCGESVTGDGLVGLDATWGVGLNLLQARTLRVGVEATSGGMFWSPKTLRNFDNDVFTTLSYLRGAVVLSIRL